MDRDEILRDKFKKENPETLELFNKAIDKIFGKKEDREDQLNPSKKEEER